VKSLWLAMSALALLGAAYCLPLPGIDQAAAHASLGRVPAWWASSIGSFPPAFSLMSGGMVGLVGARFAQDLVLTSHMTPAVRRIWRWFFAAVYVLGSSVAGLALGLTLSDRLPEMALLSGPATGALCAAGFTAAAVLNWSLAILFRNSGLGHGAPALFLVAEMVRSGRYYAELVAAIGAGEPDLGMLPLHGVLVPLGLTFLVLWRWTPHLPRDAMRGLRARGPLDLVALPLILGALGGTLASDLSGWPAWFPQSPLYDPGLVARSACAVLAVPALGFWAFRQPGRPGSSGWFVAGLAALALTCILGLVSQYPR